MNALRLAALVAALAALSAAQSRTPDPDILATVQRFFDGMRAKDTTAIRATVDSSVRLVTTLTREGKPVLRGGSFDRFLQAIAGATESLDERIYDAEVRQDDRLATVWTRYAFYLGGRLSHCGYDAFQLFKSESGWKIFAIADTQRREGCVP